MDVCNPDVNIVSDDVSKYSFLKYQNIKVVFVFPVNLDSAKLESLS